MPRQGDGSGNSAIEAGHNIIHGAGQPESTRVARADKAAPMPEYESGKGLAEKSASAGKVKGKDQGGRSSTN